MKYIVFLIIVIVLAVVLTVLGALSVMWHFDADHILTFKSAWTELDLWSNVNDTFPLYKNLHS